MNFTDLVKNIKSELSQIMSMPKDYFEKLLFTRYNQEHKAIEHYENYGIQKKYYPNRRVLYENFQKDKNVKIDTLFYYNYYKMADQGIPYNKINIFEFWITVGYNTEMNMLSLKCYNYVQQLKSQHAFTFFSNNQELSENIRNYLKNQVQQEVGEEVPLLVNFENIGIDPVMQKYIQKEMDIEIIKKDAYIQNLVQILQNKLNENIQNTQSSISSNLNSQVSTLTDYQKQIDSFKQTISVVQQQLSSIQLNDIYEQLSSLDLKQQNIIQTQINYKDINDNQKVILDNLNEQITILNKDTSLNSDNITQISSLLESISLSNITLTNIVNTLKEEITNQIQNLETETSNLDISVQTLLNDNTSNKSEIETLKTNFDILNGSISDSQTQQELNNISINEMKTKQQEIIDKQSEIQNSQQQLFDEMEEIQFDLINIKARLTEIESSIIEEE